MHSIVDARGFVPSALLTLILSCVLLGCSERPTVTAQGVAGDDWFKTGNDVFVTKHRWRTSTADGWKVEVWLPGSGQSGYYPVDVSLRLTPENHGLKSLPPVAVNRKPAGANGR